MFSGTMLAPTFPSSCDEPIPRPGNRRSPSRGGIIASLGYTRSNVSKGIGCDRGPTAASGARFGQRRHFDRPSPAAADRLEQRRRVGVAVELRLHQAVLARQQRALGIEHSEEIAGASGIADLR